MKNIKLYLLSGIAMLMLTACPSDPEPEPNPVIDPVVQTHTKEKVLPPKASVVII